MTDYDIVKKALEILEKDDNVEAVAFDDIRKELLLRSFKRMGPCIYTDKELRFVFNNDGSFNRLLEEEDD
jgi:hypothetical protein